jgi:hypothetical protein
MRLLRFKPTTSGEVLFQLVLREFCGPESYTTMQAVPALGVGGRTDALADYFVATTALNIVGRCIKKAERVRDSAADESLRHPAMIEFIQQSLGIARQGDERIDRLASLSLQAASDSHRPIKDATKKVVAGGAQELPCYLCGAMSPRKSQDPAVRPVEYEHLWPASFGGNSVVENLMPSCFHCNKAKGSMLLWHTGSIFSFCLKPSPSEEEIKTIQKREKIALHMRTILNRACDDQVTLRESAIATGPARLTSIYAIDDADAIDFFNFEFR